MFYRATLCILWLLRILTKLATQSSLLTRPFLLCPPFLTTQGGRIEYHNPLFGRDPPFENHHFHPRPWGVVSQYKGSRDSKVPSYVKEKPNAFCKGN